MCGVTSAVFYQFGMKSESPVFWANIDSASSFMPGCLDNLFHITRTHPGRDEFERGAICLLQGKSTTGVELVNQFPRLNDLGDGFGICFLKDRGTGVVADCCSLLIHMLKREGITNSDIQRKISGSSAWFQKLEAFFNKLAGNQKPYKGASAYSCYVKRHSPSSCLSEFGKMLEPRYWIDSGSIHA
jgi:hypothetical protein